MEKSECIEVFNSIINGAPISFQEKILPMVSEYLTEIKYENFDKVINLMVQNPQLVYNTLPELIEYYCRKYNIFSINQKVNNNLFNLKTILYYE